MDKEVKMEIAMRRNPFQASLLDQARHGTATLAPALVAGDLQRIELADQVAEDDCAVAGY